MDRIEEIVDAAKCRKYPRFNHDFLSKFAEDDEFIINTTLSIAFMEGAKWADKNPSTEMIHKIIKKESEIFAKIWNKNETKESFLKFREDIVNAKTKEETNALFYECIIPEIQEALKNE